MEPEGGELNASPFIILWCLAAPLILGLVILRALGLRYFDDPIASLGWAWVLGCICLGTGLFAYQALGLGVTSWWTAPLVLGGVVALAPACCGRSEPVRSDSPGPGSPYSVWLLALVSLGLLSIVAAGSLPVMESDEATIWATKAKLLFLSNGYDQAYLSAVAALPHADYPVLNPLLQAWMFSQAGEILHFSGRLPILCFALALLLIAAGALRRLVGALHAGALLLVIVGGEVFQVYSQRAYSDIMLACGCLMAFDGWLRWHANKNNAYAAIACFGMALALWSKNEAVLYLTAALVATLLQRMTSSSQRVWPWTPWLLLPIALCLGQYILNSAHGLQNDLLGDNPSGDSMFSLMVEQFSDRSLPLLAYTWEHWVMQPLAPQGVYLFLIPALLLIPGRIWYGDLGVPTLTILLSLSGTFLVYIGSYWQLDEHLETSVDRVTYQMVPFTVLWLALVGNRLRAYRS